MLFRFKVWILSKFHKRKYKIYKTLDFLPIWNFKQIEKTQDLRYLIKSIDYESLPTVYLDLDNIWEILHMNFIEQSNPEGIQDMINSYIMNYTPINQYNFLILAIKILSNKEFVSEEKRNVLINKIKLLGYSFNQSSEDEYYNSIIGLGNQLVGLKRNVNIKIQQLNDKKQDIKNQLDIEEILSMFISVFPGTVFNSKTLTCTQYLNYLKRYNAIVKDSNTKYQK
jgi:hypothetical protein